MARVDITEENLEDLLAYDDLFNDYFNKFLAQPVFATPLYYNRLTGTFVEIESPSNAIDSLSKPASPPYGATDEERETQLEWARYCRLPLFLRTELFREFKLCKLLLRPLDDRLSATNRGGSSKIRGYSRQTEDYASSLSNSGDNSGQYDFEDGQGGWEPTYRRSALYRYQRPGSRAFSLPSRVGLGPYPEFDRHTSTDNSYLVPENTTNDTTQNNTHEHSKQHSAKNTSRSATTRNHDIIKESKPPTREVTFDTGQEAALRLSVGSATSQSSRKSASGRRSSKASRRQGTPKPKRVCTPKHQHNVDDDDIVDDFDAVFGEEEPEPTGDNMVAFADVISDTQTEHDVKDLEGKHQIPVQTMKEQILGSSNGMEQFRSFLQDTAGFDLYGFWVDCENFKDTMEDFDDLELLITRNRLYRDIQDKYKLTLTREARRQIQQAAHDQGLSYTVFIRTQYDVLRRIRTYWVNRFLIHKERMNELSGDLYRDPFLVEQKLLGREKMTFFPSISLANSMPVKAEDLMQICKTTSWEAISRSGKAIDARICSAKPRSAMTSRKRSLKEKLLLALTLDKAMGGPFQNFLRGREEDYPGGLHNLLFWQEVTEYGAAEERSADRLLRLAHAWHIFSLFVDQNSKLNLGLTNNERNRIHQRLLSSRDMIEASVFNSAKEHALGSLEKAWIRYLKEDLKTFVEACPGADESPPSTAEDYEVILNDQDDQLKLYVKGPRPWTRRYPPSTASERGTRLRTALSIAESIDDGKRQERRRKLRERREMMEKERKKAVRTAMKRMREAKRKKKTPSKYTRTEDDENEESKSQALTHTEGKTYSTSDQPRRDESATPERPPTFAESAKKNKGLVGMFKKHVSDNEEKEVRGMLSMYTEIDAYQHTEKEKGKQTAKDKLANNIFKTFMEQGAKKQIQLSDRVYNKLKTEKDRPKSATLREAQTHVAPRLEEAFTKYWAQLSPNEQKSQQEMFGDGKNMAQMSKAELAMRSEDLSMMTGWKGGGKDKRGKGAGRPDGRSQPTREDQVEFLLQLSQASAGKFNLQMLYFYKYLVRYSDDESVHNNGLDNDLFFYCEVQKFKDNSHQYADDEMMYRKVQSINECYLESATPPTLQINIPTDIAQKAVRGANKYLQKKEITQTLFDEAQYSVFKNLLPYWAGFVKSYKIPTDDKKAPLTKPQRERKKRLEDIMAWKTPSAKTVNLPSLPKGASVAAFTFSLNDGMKWRDQQETSVEAMGDLGDESMIGSVMGHRRSMISVRAHKRSNTMDTEASRRSIVAK